MILNDYFKALDKEKVLDAVLDLYPDSDRDSYAYAWDIIRATKPEKHDTMEIVVSHVYCEWDHREEPDDYISVSGEDPNAPYCEYTKRSGRDISYAIEYTPWKHWLAMPVNVRTRDDRCIGFEKILAHIMWEMTFAGFDNEAIQAQRDIINDRVAEIEKWEEEGTLDDHLVELDLDKMKKQLEEDLDIEIP